MRNGLAYFSLVLLVAGTAHAVDFPIDSATNEVTYTGVAKVADEAKKDELYTRARLWVTNTFKSAKDVLQMEDKDAGILVAKGLIKTGISVTQMIETGTDVVHFKLTVKAKDGRYKYTVTEFRHEGFRLPNGIQINGGRLNQDRPKNTMKKKWIATQEKVHKTANVLVALLKKAMEKPAAGDDDDDW